MVRCSWTGYNGQGAGATKYNDEQGTIDGYDRYYLSYPSKIRYKYNELEQRTIKRICIETEPYRRNWWY